jgi:octaprenyl-diphosphate synthase
MRASIVIGAITGGAGSEMISKFTTLGTILGICFQIRDDIFDYYNNDVGKPTGNDIREGKITLPLIYALKNAPRDLSEGMMQIIESREYTEKNITRLLEFAKEYRGVEYANDRMNEYLTEAESIISDFMFNNEIKTIMHLFITYLKERIY